jgi:uncharacterized membrane protein (UPF0136 family)
MRLILAQGSTLLSAVLFHISWLQTQRSWVRFPALAVTVAAALFLLSVIRLLVTAKVVPRSSILVTLMMVEIFSSETLNQNTTSQKL